MATQPIPNVRKTMENAVSFYNYQRPHSSIEMLTPMEAVERTGRFRLRWKSYRELAIDKIGMMNGGDKNLL